ncbi:transcriptional regulator [Psychroflexus sp. S27]|uniref:helix-turn-helix domain-containing protein n=1 Tax=Psychroflexus sp. S27 TaxID=1982757 RepID=UPI000C2979B6|nr:helix-turn-helix transcriptional regulator [Psychroflexus sp. S27]PJX28493.1 transcriptional regulator [Psychroflexus sp. S27]
MAIKENNKSLLLLMGKRIKYLRKEQGLSLRKLAQRCDVDFSDINKIEKGERNMQMTTLFELAKGLEVHPRDLFDFEGE